MEKQRFAVTPKEIIQYSFITLGILGIIGGDHVGGATLVAAGSIGRAVDIFKSKKNNKKTP